MINFNTKAMRFILLILVLAANFLYGNETKYPSPNKKNICVALLVKNEMQVIERCLKSIVEIADCISICDVGSTDKTVQIANEFLKKSKIPTKITSSNWVGSGYNRTLSIQHAQETLEEFGFSLENSYILVLDADMVLNTSNDFSKEDLKLDSYSLLEDSSTFSCYFYTMRLLRAAFPWESTGDLYESWPPLGQYQNAKLHSLFIKDCADGDCTAEKRTIELVAERLQKEPNNLQYLFNLAQLSRAQKNYESAIEYYNSYLTKTTTSEEAWFSKFMLGECYKQLDKWDLALFWFLETYQSKPKRSAPLLNIASYYRKIGHNDLACVFAKYGTLIPHSEEGILFNVSPELDYLFDEELSIAAYYTRFKEEGFKAASDLLLKKNVPWYVIDQTYKNILFYVENLKNARFQPIEVDLPLIELGFEERYHPMNPSIVKTSDGYKVVCRAVNYTQVGAKIFNTIDLNGIFRTRNFLLDYDKKFNLRKKREIVEALDRERIRSCNVEGLEDCRLFDFDNNLWFTCTTSDTNPTGQRQISLCKLANAPTSNVIHVEKLIPLIGPDLDRCEKNWMPFNRDGALGLIYSCDPFIIFTPDFQTGICNTVLQYKPNYDFSRFRGSAAPVPFDDGYLMLIHEVIHHADYQRCYLHRFVYMDKNFVIKKVTLPFTFLHFGVEFCCSMTLDHSGTQVVMAIGIEDREAYLSFMDLELIRSLLHPLPLNHEFQPN